MEIGKDENGEPKTYCKRPQIFLNNKTKLNSSESQKHWSRKNIG